MGQRQLRRRDPEAELSDPEVLTMEIMGEFLGIDTEKKELYAYFKRHYTEWSPVLREINRTTFTRQMANVWAAKRELRRHLFLERIDFDPRISLIESFSIPVSRFDRAYRCRRLAEESAFGYDEVAKQTFYGLKGHMRGCWPGVIVEAVSSPGQRSRSFNAEVFSKGRRKDIGVGRQEPLEPPLDGGTRGKGAWPVGALQVEDEGEGTLAALFALKAAQDRDGCRAVGRALPGQEGVGEEALVPHLSLATQAPQPHHNGVYPSAGRSAAAELCRARTN